MNAQLIRISERARKECGMLIGDDPNFLQVLEKIKKIAQTGFNVLILGESGTGKEMAARQIHESGARRDKPFVVINCAAIPDGLAESELFGFSKGSFTGADKDRIGKFEQANGGTLFLDEIGDLSPLIQAKILRVIEEKQAYRIGENNARDCDVRLICATNKNLIEEIGEVNFREDLYYRIAEISLEMPSLRHRKTDIELLALHFLRQIADENESEKGKAVCFDRGAIRKMSAYDWPGNIRELINTVKRSYVFRKGQIIQSKDINLESDRKKFNYCVDLETTLKDAIDSLKKELICRHVKSGRTGGEISRILGIQRTYLCRMKAKYEI